MRVMNDAGGRDVVQIGQIGEDRGEHVLRARAVQIADMRRQQDTLAPAERRRDLALSAGRHRGLRERARAA